MAAIFAALVSSAQTNSIIFPQLISITNSVLMTNAELRTIVGNKLFFRNGDEYRSFHAADLNTNVFVALNVTLEQLNTKQQALDAAEQKRKDELAAQQAEQARQKQLQMQQRAEAHAAAQKRWQEQQAENAANPQNRPYVTPRESIGLGE